MIVDLWVFERVRGLPVLVATNLDLYVHGVPRREDPTRRAGQLLTAMRFALESSVAELSRDQQLYWSSA